MSRMTPSMISEIKRALWGGMSQLEIAERYHISQAAVSNVKRGTVGANVPWPNGKIGKMPSRVSAFDASAGWSELAVEYMTYPEDMQYRILEAVNDYLTELGEDPIPSISVAYEEYVNYTSMLNTVQSQERAAVAQEAENSRRSRIMELYHELLIKFRQKRRMRDLKEELSTITAEVPSLEDIPKGSTQFSYEKLTLKEFNLRCDEPHPIIVELRRNKDNVLLESLLIVAHNWKNSPSNWTQPFFFRQVKEVYEILQTYPEIIERIEKENGLSKI